MSDKHIQLVELDGPDDDSKVSSESLDASQKKENHGSVPNTPVYIWFSNEDIESGAVRCFFLGALPIFGRLLVAFLVSIPLLMAFLLGWWALKTNNTCPNNPDSNECLKVPELKSIEWMIIAPIVIMGAVGAIIDFSAVMKDMFVIRAIGKHIDQTRPGLFDFSLAIEDHNEEATQMCLDRKTSATLWFPFFIQTMDALQPLIFIVVSTFIAFGFSENQLLNIILNFLALEFVANIDEKIIDTSLKSYFNNSSVIFAIRAKVQTPSLYKMFVAVSGPHADGSGLEKLRDLAYVIKTDPQRFECLVEAELFLCRQVMSVQDALYIANVKFEQAKQQDSRMNYLDEDTREKMPLFQRRKRRYLTGVVSSAASEKLVVEGQKLISTALQAAVDARGVVEMHAASLTLDLSQPKKFAEALLYQFNQLQLSYSFCEVVGTIECSNYSDLLALLHRKDRSCPLGRLFKNVATLTLDCELNDEDLKMLVEDFEMTAISTVNFPKARNITSAGLAHLVECFSGLQHLQAVFPDQARPLHDAVATKNVRLVKLLVAGVDLNLQNQLDQTALQVAEVASNQSQDEDLLKIISLLRESSVATGSVSLHQVVSWSRLDLVEQILKSNPASANQLDKEGRTPLDIPTKSIRVILALVKAGSKSSKTLEVCSPKIGAAAAIYLIENKADVNQTNSNQQTALHHACRHGSWVLAEYLIKQKADVNLEDNESATPLHLMTSEDSASKNDYIKTMQVMLRAGADIHAVDAEGCTPLHVVKIGQLAALLIKAKSDVNLKNNDGYTPVAKAAENDSPSVVAVLLAAKADANIKNNEGEAPLHHVYGNLETVKALVEGKADPNIRNSNNSTCLIGNCDNEHKAIIEYLVKSKADVNAQDKDGETALYCAADMNQPTAVKALLAAKAKLIKTKDGETALTKATKSKSAGVIKILKEAAAADSTFSGGNQSENELDSPDDDVSSGGSDDEDVADSDDEEDVADSDDEEADGDDADSSEEG